MRLGLIVGIGELGIRGVGGSRMILGCRPEVLEVEFGEEGKGNGPEVDR